MDVGFKKTGHSFLTPVGRRRVIRAIQSSGRAGRDTGQRKTGLDVEIGRIIRVAREILITVSLRDGLEHIHVQCDTHRAGQLLTVAPSLIVLDGTQASSTNHVVRHA